MSEGDVSLIRDEDVLRRMWQQTEDFSKKKEIRSHMYRLREERLRNLYSPEPTADAKGCEFSSAQGHVNSFADQNFQSMKSKEVRDAGSPPKEFTYRGQDLKEYSNAGWNVESEDHTADGGHTHVKSVHATVEGQYDVEGGAGHFAARDATRRAHTEYSDERSSLRRDETSTDTAAQERLVRRTGDGTHVSSTTSSSSTSKIQQVSSTKHESVPYVTEQEYDQSTFDPNRNENVTRITNRSDYEQSLRRNESDQGELVSRKVEHPDDNTRVIVETRCLPDGTRVTSTRREFRVPAQSTRSESHHARSESKTFSSQQKSDIRESSSKVTRKTVDDIVESQRNVDDNDFRRQIREYTSNENDNTDTQQQRTNQRHEINVQKNVSDESQIKSTSSQTKYETTKYVNDDSVNIQWETRRRLEEDVDQTDRREVSHDDHIPTKVKDVYHIQTHDKNDQITKDRKVEEVIERKSSSDQYQTTYQSDYQKKVSNDWSPSHQAWASTLRADTPSTTRPSTRASSPRTFKSSTSSLRSSVSPDKTYRKPSSRGGSPNKVDRYSPTRTVTSDRYSSTHSTYSSTETKTNKYSSPERKPPSGRSPTRPSQSPDKSPQRGPNQRSTASPDKHPQNVTTRPSVSPVRKPFSTDDHSKTKPTPAAGVPSGQQPRTSPSRSYSPDKTLRVPRERVVEGSPEKDVGYQQPSDKDTTKRSSVSPNRKPGYMRPTAASHPTVEPQRPSKTGDEPVRHSSPKHTSSVSPDRRQYTKTDKVIDEHYKFIDEETKIHKRYEKTNVDDKKSITLSGPMPDVLPKTPEAKTRSPSPQKRTVIVTENDELYGRIDRTIETDTVINENQDDVRTVKGKTSSRETSPSKFDTYDKKKTREFLSTNETTTNTEENIKRDSLTRFDTYIKKTRDSSPTKTGPRDVVPQNKSTKYTTDDFITTEKNVEEVNKSHTKDHSRRLVTPSSSPTRKPKTVETEPSTGQSSPTTSVSGFVYFGSPRNQEPQVTDLDDETYPDDDILEPIKRPDSLEVKRSPSPSKIPCRSPTEKTVSPIKEKLPRKSSLKKPSTTATEARLPSPVEKPPTSFKVSPTEEKTPSGHHIVKKDKPEKPVTDSPIKPKPPLQRRETYEDRCRKILGMDETTTETVTKETRRNVKRTDSMQSSPSVSPCESPSPYDSPLPERTKYTDSQTEVIDFISREIDDTVKSTKNKTTSRESSPTKSQETQKSTETSENIDEKTISKTIKTKTVSSDTNVVKSTDEFTQVKRSSESPHKQKPTSNISRETSPSKPRTDDELASKSKKPSERESPKKTRDSPAKEPSPTRFGPSGIPGRTHITDVTKSEFDSVSVTDKTEETVENIKSVRPTRILKSPTRQSPHKADVQSTSPHSPAKTRSSDRILISPDRTPQTDESLVTRKSPSRSREATPGYMRTTTATTKKYDTKSTTEDIENVVSTKTVEKTTINTKPSQGKPAQDRPRSPSPSKTSPKRPDNSPDRKQIHKHDDVKHQKPRPSETPGYMKSTTSTTARKDSISVEETHKTETIDTKTSKSSVSPTRKITHEQPRSNIKPIDSKSKKPETSPERKRQLSPTKDDKIPHSGKKLPSPSDEVPGYMKTTESVSSKFEKHDVSIDDSETVSSHVEKTHYSRRSESPSRQSPNRQSISPDKKDSPTKTSEDASPKLPGYMKPTTAVSNKFEKTSITVDSEETVSSQTTVKQSSVKQTPSKTRDISPKSDNKSPQRRPSPVKNNLKEAPNKPSDGQDRTPNYMKPTASIISRNETEDIYDETTKKIIQSEESRRLRSPSPTKKPIEISSEFILSEKQQEILDRVQKSLRKLSPERKEKSPSRERSPTKSTTSLQDIDIVTSESVQSNTFTEEDISEVVEEQSVQKKHTKQPNKPSEPTAKDRKPSSKPSSRNVSPTKKTPSTPTKLERAPEFPTKSRSISPRKPVSQVERPQSPQVQKASGIKPREPVHPHLTRKPTPATLKLDKLSIDTKKTNSVTKQNAVTKTTTVRTTSTTSKLTSPTTNKTIVSEPKRIPSPKRLYESSPTRKVKDTVTRTVSDISIKSKKTAPQRMRSKPEIQISDMSSKTTTNQKTTVREPHSKMPAKNKSASSLNTSIDDDEVIIDVQQSKSSRENSPDRICPTPVNFSDDVGTPRFPDEVSEPDDDFRKRTYHTIHETESVVDDIVEICEDEELFVKKSDMNVITEDDDSLLSVNDKVNKFTHKIDAVTKPKDTTSRFTETEKKVHSDFIDENLKSDECLLTVSEKVNKFAQGPRDIKEKSPSRRIVDEYDKNTIYTDDYTKLSVNDKAHLFVETAENIKVPKYKPAQKVERPDLSNVDENLKSDECLLSVSDKVNKFVKTAEQFLTESQEVEEKEKKIKEKHQTIIKQIVDDDDDEEYQMEFKKETMDKPKQEKIKPQPETVKTIERKTPKPDQVDKKMPVKITTLRSSEAVKKAKALFENIATSQKTHETTKTTKLTDIGVMKKPNNTDSKVLPSTETVVTDEDSDMEPKHMPKSNQTKHPASTGVSKPHGDEKPRASPTRLSDIQRPKSPMRHTEVTKTVVNQSVGSSIRPESPVHRSASPRPRTESDKQEKVPGYLRPTVTSQNKEETKVVEEYEVSSRRGSGKFGVELRKTSAERSTASSERRRSVDHPCIEDIFELDLLEQMLENVVGYEQRRRIRSQIRLVKKDTEHNVSSHTKTIKQVTSIHTSSPKPRSPERQPAKSPERSSKSTHKSPDRQSKSTTQKPAPERSQPRTLTNGHSKEPVKTTASPKLRPQSPEKPAPKSAGKSVSRQPSPEKKRTASPTKFTSKPKQNKFNEYASAYIKKVGLNEAEKVTDVKTNKTKQTVKHETQETVQEFTTTKSITERTSSKDVIEIVSVNGNKSPSPERAQSPVRKAKSPERKATSPVRKSPSPVRKASPERKVHNVERLHQRTPSPDFKRPVSDKSKETIIKTVLDIEKKIPQKQVHEEKPSWVTNRNLRKITNESRTFSSKKIESEKPKYRAPSPSKVITKPIDVITSSYGPGPLDADGKPLFGIKALRNGATNFQVKGTVVRQEFHSRNGGEPEGVVSVTAYSSQPEDLEQLMASQGMEPPSRLHGLSAITTTKKFGGDTGTTYSKIHTKEERASLDQFTHNERKMEVSNRMDIDSQFTTHTESTVDAKRIDKNRDTERREEKKERIERREDKKTVRQSSVKSLTEKYIKSANESGKVDRSKYPKAGLILRTTARRESYSSEDATPARLGRADSEHSLGSPEEVITQSENNVCTTRTTRHEPATVTRETVTRVTHAPVVTKKTTVLVQEPVVKVTQRHTERSFLDSNTKVTGVQDILTRMKNADIVIQEGESTEDSEARALLNKFLGATVLMAGMQGYVSEQPTGNLTIKQEVRSSSGGSRVTTSTKSVEHIDLDNCWDEPLLRKLLEQCTDYEQRRRLRARIRTLMAEQEACADAVSAALGGGGTGEGGVTDNGTEARDEERVTVSSSVRTDSSGQTVSSSTTTTKTSKVSEMSRPAPKPVSPFAKFRQLEKQNSTNSPNSPQSPSSPSQPYFKFTDPALHTSALTIKERLLQWCRDKTRDYENVKLENFSTSWADGLAFCALIHHFLPDAFDYSQLTADKRRHNFTLAFKIADEKAGIYPLLDVDDMVAMRKPDWKCVFTYVQSIYRRFKDQD